MQDYYVFLLAPVSGGFIQEGKVSLSHLLPAQLHLAEKGKLSSDQLLAILKMAVDSVENGGRVDLKNFTMAEEDHPGILPKGAAIPKNVQKSNSGDSQIQSTEEGSS